MRLYRGKLRAKVSALVDAEQLTLPSGQTPARLRRALNRLGRLPWHVYVGERYTHGDGVAVYLARYVRGGPLGKRQLSVNSAGQHTLHYTRHRRDTEGPRRAKLHLSADELIGRILTHVPVHRKRIVRSYGLYASGCKGKLNQAREALGQEAVLAEAPIQWTAFIQHHQPQSLKCRRCGAPIHLGEAIGRNRGPPR